MEANLVIIILSLTASVLALINKSVGVSTGRTIIQRSKDFYKRLRHRNYSKRSFCDPLIVKQENEILDGIIDVTERVVDLVSVAS